MTLKGKLQTHCNKGHEFTPENTYTWQNKSGNGRGCRECRRLWHETHPRRVSREKAKQYRDKWNAENPNYFKINDLNRLYKLTLEQFNQLFEKQKGLCSICLNPLIKANVDHDHNCCSGKITCGKCIRGLLCDGCNTALGRFKDSEEILQRAINYLREYK